MEQKAHDAGVYLVKALVENKVSDADIKVGLRMAGMGEEDIKVVFYHGVQEATI